MSQFNWILRFGVYVNKNGTEQSQTFSGKPLYAELSTGKFVFIYAHKFIAHLWFNEPDNASAFGWVTTIRVRVRARAGEWKITCTRANSFIMVFFFIGVVRLLLLGRLFLSHIISHLKKVCIWKMTQALTLYSDSGIRLADNYFETSELCKNLKAITNLKTVYFVSFHFKVVTITINQCTESAFY